MRFILIAANAGILAGLMAGTLVLLRPVLVRMFTAQQRAVIWLAVWSMGYMPWLRRGAVLPVNFQRFVVPRTGSLFTDSPAFLPAVYEGPGPYHLAVPGRIFVEVPLTDALVYGAVGLWAAGIAALCVYSFLRDRELTRRMKAGRLLGDDDPVYESYRLNRKILEGESWVWMVEGLPTSFVKGHFLGLSRKNDIVIQSELPQAEMELVLLHESQHVHLWHPWWKVIAAINVVIFWWNPLIWLGFRYFCRDLELACDAAVLKKLTPEGRKRYAELLVELGSGRQLWEVPLAFGECDAAVRVKTAAGWRPRKSLLNVLTWCAAVGLILFLYGGQRIPYPAADLKLTYERQFGGEEVLREDITASLAEVLRVEPESLGEIQAWESPAVVRGQVEVAGMWIRTGDGTWYLAPYGWWGDGTDLFHILSAEVCAPPDLTGALRLV